jgi:hypothetical protein
MTAVLDVSLSAAESVLEQSTERDRQLALRLAAYRQGFRHGWDVGVDRGRRQAEREQAASWYAATHPIAIGGISHAELERRRWGPGGREHFADPRPGDYPGQDGAA